MRVPERQGGNLDSVRRHNLSVVVGLVHHSGAISRSLITRETALNRSTVGALAAELVELGLVFERDPDPSVGVGRPSPVIEPSPSIAALAVNPEIDAIAVALVGFDGRVRGRVRRETAGVPSAAEAVRVAAEAAAELRAAASGTRIVGAGVAVPGLVRASDGLVRRAPHLGWIDEPFAAELEAAIGLPVYAANDAQLGAYAEHLYGAGAGAAELLYVNGGASGIGGGVIAGGEAFVGAAGHAGELGHLRVTDSSDLDSGGLPGTLEAEVSRGRLLELLELQRVDAEQFEAALLASHDPRVAAEVARQLDILGVALGSALTLLNPSLIVLGGFLATLHEADAARLDRAIAAAALPEALEGVRVTRTALGSDILLVGAAELAFVPVLDDPAGAIAALDAADAVRPSGTAARA